LIRVLRPKRFSVWHFLILASLQLFSVEWANLSIQFKSKSNENASFAPHMPGTQKKAGDQMSVAILQNFKPI
jgi:predicted outer membrane protein